MDTIRIEMNEGLGYYPLMTLATEDVLNEAFNRSGSSRLISLRPAIASRANGAIAATASVLPSIGRCNGRSTTQAKTASCLPK